MFSSKKLAKVLYLLSQRKNADILIHHFFRFLEEKNLLYLLPNIKKHLLRMVEQNKELNTIFISTRYPLKEQLKGDILEMLRAEGAISENIQEKEDVSLIGGFLVRSQGKQYDGSIRNTIIQLEEHLSQ